MGFSGMDRSTWRAAPPASATSKLTAGRRRSRRNRPLQPIANTLHARGASPAAIAYLAPGVREDERARQPPRRDASPHRDPLQDPRRQRPAAAGVRGEAVPAHPLRLAPSSRSDRTLRGRRPSSSRRRRPRERFAATHHLHDPFHRAPLNPGRARAGRPTSGPHRPLSSGSVTRIELQTRRRFWEAAAKTDSRSIDRPMEIWNPTWDQPGPRGILQAYVYEGLARTRPASEAKPGRSGCARHAREGASRPGRQLRGRRREVLGRRPLGEGRLHDLQARPALHGGPSGHRQPQGRISSRASMFALSRLDPGRPLVGHRAAEGRTRLALPTRDSEAVGDRRAHRAGRRRVEVDVLHAAVGLARQTRCVEVVDVRDLRVEDVERLEQRRAPVSTVVADLAVPVVVLFELTLPSSMSGRGPK